MQDVLEEYKLESAKGLPTPPCLRDLLDKSLDEASLRVPLTPEAAARNPRVLKRFDRLESRVDSRWGPRTAAKTFWSARRWRRSARGRNRRKEEQFSR